MKNAEIIAKLNLEQKCALLSGAGTFTTRGCPKAGVPSITLSDGPNGVRKQAGAADHLGLNPSVPATCFPTAATVACSWDPALGEEIGRAMGEEAAAQEVAVLLGPGLNTKRSPLCGRNFEYFSEDPYLSGKMAAAYVRGIQSEGIAACPKHFAVNSQELRRMASDSVLDERTLRELYLTGFEIVVKEAAPKTIMSSYNLVNGTYANENAHLLQDILRRDWGFSGAVVTDWGGSNDHALGVKNGSTLEMPAPGGDAVRELLAAVQSGKITEADVDARLDEIQEASARLQGDYDAIEVAMEALKEADDQLHARFSPQLSQTAAGYFQQLTQGRFSQVALDRSFNVTVRETGALADRPLALLSQGTADQLYLALRLAVADLVLPSPQACPLILDDALVTFDDDRLRAALDYLLSESKNRQILLFTCHDRERAYLQGRENVSVIRL